MEKTAYRKVGGAAIQVGAAALGGALAGPLGVAVGGWLGKALGDAAVELAKKFLDLGSESLAGKLDVHGRPLAALYRESLRMSLADLRKQPGTESFSDWFANWERCLESSNAPDLDETQTTGLTSAKVEDFFKQTMIKLDRQGAAMLTKSQSLTGGFRKMPPPLLDLLQAGLPALLQVHFEKLIVTSEYEPAWKQVQLVFQEFSSTTLSRVDKTTQGIDHKTDEVLERLQTMERSFLAAQQEGRISPEQLQAKDAEIARLTEELGKLRAEVTARASEPGEKDLGKALASGDLERALQIKTAQVEARREQAEKLPRDLFELGKIHELRFDWPKALEAYRGAWTLRRDPAYGFAYAYAAQRQNQFSEAIGVYEGLRKLSRNPAEIATTLNNLAVLYSDTQRMEEAEEAYEEALEIRQKLAKANPEAYLPDVAMTLNNLAALYYATQRMKEAEGAYGEALKNYRQLAKANPEAYLPNVAMTLNNLAVLYSDTQRMKEAEEAYREALKNYRELAKANPEAYLPDVAMTLNNLAALYYATQRMKDAEETYGEALEKYRKLAGANPEAYEPNVATTLNNLAVLYRATQRMKEAEEAYREALKNYRQLAAANPEAYLPYVAATLNNLANLYGATQRVKKAEEAYREALGGYHQLAKANPEAYLPDVAMTLNNLAVLYHATQRMNEAEEAYKEALGGYHQLAKANPEAYLPDVAMTLNNLANLYRATQRMTEAEEAYKEALEKYRKLAGANPEAYLPYVATTLNNLAVLYSATQRMKEAEEVCREAERILEPLWETNPAVHGDQMAGIWGVRALLAAGDERRKQEARDFAQRALDAAYDPRIKEAMGQLLERLSSE